MGWGPSCWSCCMRIASPKRAAAWLMTFQSDKVLLTVTASHFLKPHPTPCITHWPGFLCCTSPQSMPYHYIYCQWTLGSGGLAKRRGAAPVDCWHGVGREGPSSDKSGLCQSWSIPPRPLRLPALQDSLWLVLEDGVENVRPKTPGVGSWNSA